MKTVYQLAEQDIAAFRGIDPKERVVLVGEAREQKIKLGVTRAIA